MLKSAVVREGSVVAGAKEMNSDVAQKEEETPVDRETVE